MDKRKILSTIKSAFKEYSPEMLIGVGIAGMLSSTVSAVIATPKALMLIENAKNEAEDVNYSLKKRDYVKLVWKCYAPSVILAMSSIGCIVGADIIRNKQKASLTAAYTLATTALTDYKKQVAEEIGVKKQRNIEDNISKKRMEANPPNKSDVLIVKKDGSLCYEDFSSRYFKADINTIDKAINTLNKMMLNEMYVSLNDLYYELGLPNTSLGADVGWNISDGLIEVWYGAKICEDGNSCIVLHYEKDPRYGYSKIF